LECTELRKLDKLGRCVLKECPEGQVFNEQLGICGTEVTPADNSQCTFLDANSVCVSCAAGY
jgi:hypothetical protein